MAKKSNKNTASLVVVLVLAAGAAVAAFQAISDKSETTSYWALNQDVPTGTRIDQTMLQEIVVNRDGAPMNAVGIDEIQMGRTFTKFPLDEGDVLSASNTGGFADVAVGVPDEWVTTTIPMGADNAVGGRIVRGTYFDMLVTTEDGSFYPFINVLALDTTIDTSGLSSSEAIHTEEARQGQTTQYTIAGTPSDVGRIQHLFTIYGGQIRFVLSPRQNDYALPRVGDFTGVFNLFSETPFSTMRDPHNDDVAVEVLEPKNLGLETDNSWTDFPRDGLGRPIGKNIPCSVGNNKIYGDACEKIKAEGKTDFDKQIGGETDADKVDLGSLPQSDLSSPPQTQTPDEGAEGEPIESVPVEDTPIEQEVEEAPAQ